jgi:hypothetical protein
LPGDQFQDLVEMRRRCQASQFVEPRDIIALAQDFARLEKLLGDRIEPRDLKRPNVGPVAHDHERQWRVAILGEIAQCPKGRAARERKRRRITTRACGGSSTR